LVFQNCSLILTLRYSKTLPEKYISSTAVVCSEILKFIVSLSIYIYLRFKEIKPPNKFTFKMLVNEIFGKESDYIKVTIPAVLYLIQNNLNYFAVSKIDAATYQITYQMKIITTAVSSVIILNHKLYKHQWLSLSLLFVGIVLVQFSSGDSSSKKSENSMYDKIIGVTTIFICSILSGLSGVYFEKILKKNKVPLWVRNVQLSLLSIITGYLVSVLFLDGEVVREKGFFSGYTRWTVLVIILQAFGGILVSVVVKYADNIVKGYATSISIILSCIISHFIFDFSISLVFIVGLTFVIAATFLYGKPVKQEKKDETEMNLLNNKEIV